MGSWIIPCNLSNYDLDSAFSARQEVDWKQIKNIEAGDRVLIYIASPVSAVRYRCVVKETGLPGPNVIGAEYNRDETPYGGAESHMTLVKAFEYDDPRLSLKALRTMGLGHVQGPRRTPAKLDELVSEIEESAEFESVFAPTDDPVATIRAKGCYEEGKRVVSLERDEYHETVRSAAARKRCLALKGTACSVCGVDYGELYGVEGGIVQVHHAHPLGHLVAGETVMTDPVKDLWPVCPNCHALIHSKGQDEEYTIAEARKIVLQAHH